MTPTTNPAAARTLIETADPTNPDSVLALEALRFTDPGEEVARDVLSGNPAGTNVAWAAAWVYASSASDSAPLKPLLEHSNATVRAIAAAGIVAMGDRAGFDVLRVLLSDETEVLGSHPPLTVGTFALATVSRYVVADGAPPAPQSPDEVESSKTTWSDWLVQNGAALRFDSATGTWSAP